MIRPLLAAAVAVTAIGASQNAVAGAEPAACSYTLSRPHVVQVSGIEMVTATMEPTACDGANPYLSVACVQLQGEPGPGRCRQNNGPLTARVYLSPYRPGATYVATGEGCASKGNPPQPHCQPSGPLVATL
jgi:hypothetical protein